MLVSVLKNILVNEEPYIHLIRVFCNSAQLHINIWIFK